MTACKRGEYLRSIKSRILIPNEVFVSFEETEFGVVADTAPYPCSLCFGHREAARGHKGLLPLLQ